MSTRETEALARPGAPSAVRPIVTGPPILTGPPVIGPNVVGDPPNITGINPAHAVAGTNVEIDGTNFDNVIGVTFGPLGAGFKNDSSTVVHAIVPPGLSGPTIVTVTTEPPTGTQTLTTTYPFTIDHVAPVVQGFQPSEGVTGSHVQITGTALDSVTSVSFNGAAAQFTHVSDTVLDAVVPDDATTGKISISDGSDPASYSATPFTVVPQPPAILDFKPESGTAGQQVAIVGKHLSKVTGVFFNKVSAKIVNPNPGQPLPNQQLTVIVPNATTGPVHVDSPNGGATSSKDFVVILAPVVQSVTPSSARAGTKVTLAGKHLGELTAVTVNGQTAKFAEKSEKSVKVTIPNVAPGPATIAVTNAAGQAQIGFTVTV
jgi:hypothetical protein